MNRKEKNILFFLLACAALFVAVLYSPIGSPNDYLQSPYFAKYQGVTFSGRIQNSSKFGRFNNNASRTDMFAIKSPSANYSFSSNDNEQNVSNVNVDVKDLDVSVSQISTIKKSSSSYAVNTNTSYESNNGNTSYTVSTKSNIISNQNSSGASGGGGIGNAGAVIIGKTSNGNDNQNPLPTGFTALNIDLSVFNDLITRQGNPPDLGVSTDPGEDPLGPPIPVPDGFWLLLIMALGYTGFKFIKRKKLDTQV